MAAIIDTERRWLTRMRGRGPVVRNGASWRAFRGYEGSSEEAQIELVA
jgi:hypothetical protein